MRWPWSDRAPAQRPLDAQAHALKCDECIVDPARIRQLLEELTRQQASLTLLARGQLPMIARISTDSINHHVISLTTSGHTDGFVSEVTAHTRLKGIDLVFSSHLQATGTDEWTLDLPDELLYLNLRRYFRANGIEGGTVAFTSESGRAVTGELTNLSEQGACVALSPFDAQFIGNPKTRWQGRLVMKDLTLVLGTIHIHHATPTGDKVLVGLSFRLSEGAESQLLRQTLQRHQWIDAERKKNYFSASKTNSLQSKR